jgi:hypothetical protein
MVHAESMPSVEAVAKRDVLIVGGVTANTNSAATMNQTNRRPTRRRWAEVARWPATAAESASELGSWMSRAADIERLDLDANEREHILAGGFYSYDASGG